MPKGRTAGATTFKKYKWEVTMYDPVKKCMIQGKYSTRDELNQDLGLNLNLQTFWRIRKYTPDPDQVLKERSFLQKYGHIKIKEINEYRDGFNRLTPRIKIET
jgi:hypothetical protein